MNVRGGVLRLLGEDERDTVSAAEINRVREGLAAGCQLQRPHHRVSAGTRVRVRSGALGVQGVVTELRHQCKVIIGLAAIQQSFSLEVGLDDVEVLNKTVVNPVQVPMLANAD